MLLHLYVPLMLVRPNVKLLDAIYHLKKTRIIATFIPESRDALTVLIGLTLIKVKINTTAIARVASAGITYTINFRQRISMDIPQFAGGWSYTQREMTELFKHITYPETYSILEFGSGASTILLFNHFTKYVKNLQFITFESNKNFYTNNNPGITYVYYDEDNIQNVNIPGTTYDLILIDGPNGNKRSMWYEKIRNHVKEGTIILIDDFNHYACFSEELDRNFTYDLK
jgi:hypothetical protein